MQIVCRLSHRWHQQFCRSPSFAGHRRCLLNLQSAREYRQAVRGRTSRPVPPNTERDGTTPTPRIRNLPTGDIVVREFEPDPDDNTKLNRIEPNAELVEEMADTEAELMKLEEELAVMRQGPFGPQSEFMQALPKDQREQLLRTLAEEGILQGDQEDLLTMSELERLAEEDEAQLESTPKALGVTLKIPRKEQALVRHFNRVLQAAAAREGLDTKSNLDLWRWYLRCQQQVHNFPKIITDDVWQLLWTSQAGLKGRPKHLVMLAEDMLKANQTLDGRQWLVFAQALHNDGNTVAAIQIWQQQKPNLRSDSVLANEFWALGVKLYAGAEQPLKAQELALNALSNDKADPEILVPVIIAWAKSSTPADLVKAWACYLKFRQYGGDLIPSDLYEKISNAFLDTNHGDMALSVFKDMLLSKDASVHDSRYIYKQATKNFKELLDHAKTEQSINQVGLSSLLVLPVQFQNRYFFASWIKKLIGENRVDSAAMVVELMYERGIAPDAKPLNGIIGAWLRDGTTRSQDQAVRMAWSMIEARANFVQQRKETETKEKGLYRRILTDSRSMSVRRKIPSATIETFSILLQYYTRRQDAVQAERLTRTMIDSCEIQPNSYIMNHWLYRDLRAGRLSEVWKKYCDLRKDIKPDLETFAALWDTAKVHFSKSDPARAQYFPSARELYAEMKDWYSYLSPNAARRARADFSAELYEQIIRCFCLSTDLPGTILAMHSVADSFQIYPTDNVLRLVCGQAARLLPHEEQVSVRATRPRRSIARHRSTMTRIAEIIDTIESQKKIAMVDSGADPEAVEDSNTLIAQRMRLAVLTEFICMFMQKTQARTGSYRNDVKIAATTMHVDMDGVDLDVPD